MKRILNIMIAVVGLIALMDTIGCGSSGSVDGSLNIAEDLMEDRPDSSLYILNGINASELRGNGIKARYALLKSMALDKNYIDMTTFEVLQPAIDYYLNHGNADEKFRTYYYKGRIHRNTGDYDSAMLSYLSALDMDEAITDSLMLARLLVAQGALYSKQYRIEDCIDNNLKAADIYGKLGERAHQLKCNLRALNGEIILDDKLKADSIFESCNAIINDLPYFKKESINSFLKYAVSYGTDDEIKYQIEELPEDEIGDELKIILAKAYSKIGRADTGLRYLNEANISPDDILDSLTYLSVKSLIMEGLGDERGALDAFRNYSRLLETYHTTLFNNELLFSEKKHEMEIENMAKIQKRDRVITWILIGAAILVLIMGSIYYRYRINKARRLIAERNAEKLQLETEKLQLEAENLQLEVGRLEEEHERLNGLLERSDVLSVETMKIIRERLEMLNGLLAKEITSDESHADEFRKYVDLMKKDRKKFQKSLRRDLEATHPHFFADLEKRGLTDREIDYVCLYAIGLRGKEVGGFLDVAGHYNISSEIRRKLGLEANGKNLGPFIRKMMGERR